MNIRAFLAATVTSGVLLSSAHAVACPFSQLGPKATNTAGGAPLSSQQFDFNKLGIVGAGAAAVLAVGAIALRRASQATPEADDFAVSTFAIPVPPEALTPSEEAAADVHRVS